MSNYSYLITENSLQLTKTKNKFFCYYGWKGAINSLAKMQIISLPDLLERFHFFNYSVVLKVKQPINILIQFNNISALQLNEKKTGVVKYMSSTRACN